jgi:hypothetical protein
MVAPQQIIKKNKGQGFYIFYTYKTVKFYNKIGTEPSLGFLVFGIVCKLSVNIGKTIAKKRKTCLELSLK